jgi:hypothetical protein
MLCGLHLQLTWTHPLSIVARCLIPPAYRFTSLSTLGIHTMTRLSLPIRKYLMSRVEMADICFSPRLSHPLQERVQDSSRVALIHT